MTKSREENLKIQRKYYKNRYHNDEKFRKNELKRQYEYYQDNPESYKRKKKNEAERMRKKRSNKY